MTFDRSEFLFCRTGQIGQFAAGTVVRTLLAKTGVIIHQTAKTPTFEVYVHRSFADYAWRWLADAGLEYGVSIAGG